MVTKLDAALLIAPFDLIATVAAFGAEQAFQWTGTYPKDEHAFYIELGRKISAMTNKAWEEELPFGEEDHLWE